MQNIDSDNTTTKSCCKNWSIHSINIYWGQSDITKMAA